MLRQIYLGLILEEDESGVGAKIAKKLKLIFNGIQREIRAFVFTDPLTKSTFYAGNEKEAVNKLRQMRLKFGFA